MVISEVGGVAQVNIHGMTAEAAKRALEQTLTKLKPGVKELVVIHGYNGGQVLRDMVRLRLKHPRIAAKLLSLNPGQTRLLLK